MAPFLIGCFVFMLAFIMNWPAEAYIGPVFGLPMLGSLMALIWSVIIAIIMVLLWPLRLLYKRFKPAKKTVAPKSSNAKN